MKASNFVALYGPKGLDAWENAAVDLFRRGDVPENPWVPLHLTDGVHQATAWVSSDYLTIGEGADQLRLPLRPAKAQEILNLDGSLLPTPWLDYQIWRAAQKMDRQPMPTNKGASLGQYAAHDAQINAQLSQKGGRDVRAMPLAGHKKDVVISATYKPNTVVIHGWYRPDPDVFKDTRKWDDPSPLKQPQQNLSNEHGSYWVDYSHGIRKVHPTMIVDGKLMSTEEIYRSRDLSKLVSAEGPLLITRYPTTTPFAPTFPTYPPPTVPGTYADRGLRIIVDEYERRGRP